MAIAGSLVGALGVYLTGGPTNNDPELSLGGIPSTHRMRALGVIVSDVTQVPGLRIDHVFPAVGEGTAFLSVGSDGASVSFAAPGDDLAFGDPVALPEGATRLLFASSGGQEKGILVTRIAGFLFPPGKLCQMKLVLVLNEALAMGNVPSALRVTGGTTYRCLALAGEEPYGTQEVKVWLPATAGLQSTYSIGSEDPVAGAVQTIANETTPPTGITWVSPALEAGALSFGRISSGTFRGLWIRRVFPAAGVVHAEEHVRLGLSYQGA